jgi:hypothetical protein
MRASYDLLRVEQTDKRAKRPAFGVLAATLFSIWAAGPHISQAQTTSGNTNSAPSTSAASAPVASPAAAPTPVPPLSSPTMVGPLTMASANEINIPKYVPLLSELPAPLAGLLDFDVNGAVSALGYVQNHPVPGDYDYRGDFSNAQLFIQKADGIIQYYVQVGGYSIPALGSSYIPLHQAVNSLYGVVPVGYLKIAPTSNFSIMGGNLPTLIGAEYTFTFENLNIERGLLWNQENAINRGLQLNYTYGPLSASLSWNNGFYSHSYTWLDGSIAWAINSSNTLSFVGGGNLGYAASNNLATPLLQNNSQIYNLIYTYNASPWILTPYFQVTVVPHNPAIGAFKTTSTMGEALMGSYAFTEHFSLAARAEYIMTTGNKTDGAANLLYGPGSQAWSATITPTYQYKQFFGRVEGSVVNTASYTTGATFGKLGDHPTQVRGAMEVGFLF